MKQAHILIVDDQESNTALLEAILRADGYESLTSTNDPAETFDLIARTTPDVLVLDLHMPRIDGFEVLRRIQGSSRRSWFQVLVLTADDTSSSRDRAFRLGAADFLHKPFDRTEVLLRIRNLVAVQMLQLELRAQNEKLDRKVYERTEELSEARLEVLARLAFAAEFRDDDTGEHTQRVGRTAASIAHELHLAETEVSLIGQAAPLHDIGKIGIPDQILLKPGRLSDDERQVMQLHSEIGGSILSGSSSPLLEVGERIACTHHERWDGGGYPLGLTGEAIPLVGRVVAVADVFDALTHERPYKSAWPVDRAVEEIRSLSGRQFDPAIVETFERLPHDELLTSAQPIGVAAPREAILDNTGNGFAAAFESGAGVNV